MNRYFLFALLLSTSSLFGMEKHEEKNISHLPTEIITEVILPHLLDCNRLYPQIYSKVIKNIRALAHVNKRFYSLINSKEITKKIIKNLAKNYVQDKRHDISIAEYLRTSGASKFIAQDFKALYNQFVLAASRGDIPVLNFLISQANKTDLDEYYTLSSALFSAAKNGHLKAVQTLIEFGAPINESYVLCTAASYGHLDIVQKLIQLGADVNYETDLSYINNPLLGNPLSNAVMNGHYEMVKLLLDSGADMTKKYDNENIFVYANFIQNEKNKQQIIALLRSHLTWKQWLSYLYNDKDCM